MSNQNEKSGYFESFISDRKITLKSIVALILSSMALFMVLYFLMTAYFGAPVAIVHRLIFLLFILFFTFILNPTKRKRWSDPFSWYVLIDIVLTLAVIAVGIYFLYDIDGWQTRLFQPSASDTIFGIITVLLVLEATRRTVGYTMVFVSLFFILHTKFANVFPGILRTAPTTWSRLIDVLSSSEGILSEPIASMASYIILFLVFGALLEQTGAGKFFIDIAYSIGGRFTAGPAKTAVLASALFGSISGSSVSNVVSTGCFTIPLMKSVGYTKEEAGAIEAVASTGGNYMPPIMGAVAFLMAQYLSIPYIQVVKNAILPALLYYVSLLMMVHFEGVKKSIKPLPKEELPNLWETLKSGGHLLLSLVILIVFLIQGYTATMAAFWGIVVLFVLSFLKKETRLNPMRLIRAFEGTAKTAITVGMACACAGIIMGCMFSSGLGVRLSTIIIRLAGGKLYLGLIYTAIISLILGCGMPSVGVYLILLTTIIPALIEMGVVPVAAHFFAFYWAIVSNITPPVAVAAFAGAAIAGASPMKTGFKAFQLGAASYIIPFIFVYSPTILMIGDPLLILRRALFTIVCMFCLASAVTGFFRQKLSIFERVLMISACVLLFDPNLATSIIGISCVVTVIIMQRRTFNIKNIFFRRG